jgi:hypothetical protein
VKEGEEVSLAENAEGTEQEARRVSRKDAKCAKKTEERQKEVALLACPGPGAFLGVLGALARNSSSALRSLRETFLLGL